MKLAAVLYVEDEENDVLFMQRAFLKSGIANPLHVARDGEQALAYLQVASGSGELPCLILLDLKLPLMSGFEVLDWIRNSQCFRSTPVCVLSSSDQPRDIERSKQKGADEYQVKPSSPSQLHSFAEWLRRRWPIDDAISTTQEAAEH